MFWVGLIIALIGLLERNLIRRKFFPRKYHKTLEIFSIIIFIVGIGISAIEHISDQNEINKLQNQFVSDNDEIKKLKNKNNAYQKKIKELEGQVDILEYQEVSVYNANGNKSVKINGVPLVPTPINDWSKSFVSRVEGKPVFKCESSSVKACQETIDKLPSYPFAYFLLALCQKESGDQSWRQSALKAKSILEKTVMVSSHHSDHDLILVEVEKMLKH